MVLSAALLSLHADPYSNEIYINRRCSNLVSPLSRCVDRCTNEIWMVTKVLSGAGVYRKGKDRWKAFSLGEQETVFQAEVFPILEVATREEVIHGHEICIYSENQAALKAILRPRKSSALARNAEMN